MNDQWRAITKQFFEESGWRDNLYRGIKISKSPIDLWVYGEIIEQVRPRVIIEFGSQCGGSAMWMADQMRIRGIEGQVFSVDKSPRHKKPEWPGVTWWAGKVLDKETYDHCHALAIGARQHGGHVMIVEDSNHAYDHVLRTLGMYSKLVTIGSYFIVEDGVLDHVMEHPSRQPYAATHEFLKTESGQDYVIDPRGERFKITFHPDGFLKRVR